MITMSSEVERGSDSMKSSKEDELQVLELEFRTLQEKTQELISERTHLESELRSVKKKSIIKGNIKSPTGLVKIDNTKNK